jgi:shikimate dehydrogenase
MGRPFAEVIGDPVAHSKSPAIHAFWLEAAGLAGDYRAVRVPSGGLRAYFEQRRRDPFWRGCSITAPLKREAATLLGDPTGVCAWLGAVNCVFRSPLGPVPANTDLTGIAEALAGISLEGRKACLVGSGGAAMAALCWLVRAGASKVAIVSRDARRAGALAGLAPTSSVTTISAVSYDDARSAISEAALLIHATPMGMDGGPPMRSGLIGSLDSLADGATVFDMVYAPAETELLRVTRARGLNGVDGLSMLIGQAAPAFELFFGAPAPRARDSELRERLAG